MIILENQLLNDKMFSLPKKLEDHLKLILNNHIGDKESKGYKRLNSLVNSNYNDRSGKQSDNGKKFISYSDLKRINHDFDNMLHSKDNKEFVLNGGQEMCDWVKQTLENSRDAVEPQLKKIKQDTIRKNKVKNDKNATRPSSIRRMLDSLSESVDDGEHPYFDYISEYNESYVFYSIKGGDNLWNPLINPMMYKKALDEFMKFGYLMNFPNKYVYQWMGNIMKNTATLRACTSIAGHDTYYPISDLIDVFFNGEEDLFEKYKVENGLESDSDAYDRFCDENGIYDALSMPDGSDAWSDYGITPLEKLISEYNPNMEVEKVLVLINRILDITHTRGDLSSIFIEGGAKTLTRISYNESKQNKKIYVLENQMNELRQQMILPFDGEYEKMVYQHFIDFLEAIGRYGQLPKSPVTFDEVFNQTLNENTNKITKMVLNNMENNRDFITYMLYELSQEELESYLDIDDDAERSEMAEEILRNYDVETFINNINDNGIEYLREEIPDNITYKLAEDNFNVNSDERNLVKIERLIQLPPLTSRQGDFYKELMDKYGGVGNYWSFENGDVYNPQYNGDVIGLVGLVDPRAIDMVQTIYCGLYDLANEKEINLPNGAVVEITDIITDEGKRLPLSDHIIVKV